MKGYSSPSDWVLEVRLTKRLGTTDATASVQQIETDFN